MLMLLFDFKILDQILSSNWFCFKLFFAKILLTELTVGQNVPASQCDQICRFLDFGQLFKAFGNN